jgi:small-conductance mechanosensitive channel
MNPSLLFWGLTLIVGLPILTVALEEAIKYLERQGNPLASFLLKIRRYFLPLLIVLLVLQQVFELENDQLTVQIVRTLTTVSMLAVLISLMNGILTTGEKQKSWQIHVPNLLFQTTRAAIIAIVAVYTIAFIWGVDLSRVAATLGVGSLVIALALQDTLSNLVSGFLLILEGPIKVNDWVVINDVKGKVIDINWRSVRIRDLKNDVFIIPNGSIAKDKFINSTIENPYSEHSLSLTFSYQDPPNRVKPILKKAVLSAEGVQSVLVRVFEFKEYGVEYAIYYVMLDSTSISKGRDAVLSRIYYAVKRHHLTIPYPCQTLHHVNSCDLEKEDSQQEIAEFLHSLSYFKNLDSSLIDELSTYAIIYYYGMGENIVKIGEMEEGLYIIREGSVKITVEDFKGQEKEILRLGEGEFFGEMSLLPKRTNSTVNVTVINDVKIIFINERSAEELMEDNRKLALVMNQFIEERNRLINQAKQTPDLPSSEVNSITV